MTGGRSPAGGAASAGGAGPGRWAVSLPVGWPRSGGLWPVGEFPAVWRRPPSGWEAPGGAAGPRRVGRRPGGPRRLPAPRPLPVGRLRRWGGSWSVGGVSAGGLVPAGGPSAGGRVSGRCWGGPRRVGWPPGGSGGLGGSGRRPSPDSGSPAFRFPAPAAPRASRTDSGKKSARVSEGWEFARSGDAVSKRTMSPMRWANASWRTRVLAPCEDVPELPRPPCQVVPYGNTGGTSGAAGRGKPV